VFSMKTGKKPNDFHENRNNINDSEETIPTVLQDKRFRGNNPRKFTETIQMHARYLRSSRFRNKLIMTYGSFC